MLDYIIIVTTVLFQSSHACYPIPDITYSKPKIADIELSEDARKELEIIQESDRRRKAKVLAGATPTAAPISSSLSKDWSSVDATDDEDSLQHVIEYSKNHDAMYQFHYLDENNRMRKFELFNMAEPYKRHECHSSISESVPVSHPVSMVVEEEAEQYEDAAGCSSKTDEADSGLSGVEGQTDTGRRDACCSPVRYFPPPSRASGRSKPSRRHASTGGSSGQPSTSRKQHSASRSGSVVSVSGVSVGGVRSADSDSDGDGADKAVCTGTTPTNFKR
ncbi:hypothetical protein OESDEN_16142 [Oesophagostomum dentatum]|uniref:Uncharacterized protein n=1 Tax=Oesophagostomum dentatum TaxID=61180 RepID=A0A0B1SFT5_OESDE|nr:hypothetical protein OESDEN_16142 [Oesophagostomum dentatum]